jgi:hypothetical protein
VFAQHSTLHSTAFCTAVVKRESPSCCKVLIFLSARKWKLPLPSHLLQGESPRPAESENEARNGRATNERNRERLPNNTNALTSPLSQLSSPCSFIFKLLPLLCFVPPFYRWSINTFRSAPPSLSYVPIFDQGPYLPTNSLAISHHLVFDAAAIPKDRPSRALHASDIPLGPPHLPLLHEILNLLPSFQLSRNDGRAIAVVRHSWALLGLV